MPAAKQGAIAEILPKIFTSSELADDTAKRALRAVRAHLGMDVAYISQFDKDETIFREVDAPGHEHLLKPGDRKRLDDIYCRHIIEGRLPQIMTDTASHEIAASLPVTAAVPVGSHISVPITLPNGQIYGMFCCLSLSPNRTLQERDLHVMRAFADLTAIQIGRDLESERDAAEKARRVADTIASDALAIVFQPILRLSDDKIVGWECLSRFAVEPVRPPDIWFAEAGAVGMGEALELAAIDKALSALAVLPPDRYITVNASPDTIMGGQLPRLLSRVRPERVVLEVTEQISVADYSALLAAIDRMRQDGFRLAVDDAGAGYSSLRRILDLRPDFIKLDMSLTRNIDSDPARLALVDAMTSFARQTGSRLIAEGVETEEELAVLAELGVEKVQGYLIGRPAPLETVLAGL